MALSAAGVILAIWLAGNPLPIDQEPGQMPFAQDMLFSAAAVIDYVTRYDVPWRSLSVAMLCEMLSHATRAALAWSGVKLVMGSLVHALLAWTVAVAAGRA